MHARQLAADARDAMFCDATSAPRKARRHRRATDTPERCLGIILLALAVVPGYYAVTLPEKPSTDFDIIGVLYLMENLPRFFAWALMIGLGLGGLGLLVFGRREGRR